MDPQILELVCAEILDRRSSVPPPCLCCSPLVYQAPNASGPGILPTERVQT